MKRKNIVICCVAAAVLVGLLLGLYFGTRPKTVEGQKTFTVTVVHGDGSSKAFTYTTQEEYLGTVLLAEGLITGTPGEYGLYIDAVDGETASYEQDQAYWSLYEGEEYANQGIDQTPITDGGAYQLVYTRATATE